MRMNSQRWWRLLLGLVLCAATWGWPAHEAAATTSCTAEMTALNFGSVDLVSDGTLTANATLTYRCTNNDNKVAYTRVCFNLGDGSGAGAAHLDWTPRALSNGTDKLYFQLYQNVTQTIWGSDGNPSVPDPYDVVVGPIPRRANGVNGVSPDVTFTLRGVISSGQGALPPGTYTSDFTGGHTNVHSTPAADTSATVPANCGTQGSDNFGFSVSATVVKSCLVSADPLDFGSADGVVSATNIDSTTTIRVTCSKSTAYNVLLIPSNSNTGGSGVMTGQTSGNTDTVPYRLYSNAGRTTAWGSLAANGLSVAAADVTGTTQSLTVYGRVPGLPNVRPDNYKDTVTVNVTY